MFFKKFVIAYDHRVDLKYIDKIKEYFFDMAVKDAQEKYEYQEDYPEYEPYDENDSELDDMFDMSMRTF